MPSKKHVPHHSLDNDTVSITSLMGSKKQKGAPHTQASQLDPGLRYSFLEYGTQNATQASGFPEFTQVGRLHNKVYKLELGLSSVIYQKGHPDHTLRHLLQDSSRGPWEGDGLAPPTEVCCALFITCVCTPWPCSCPWMLCETRPAGPNVLGGLLQAQGVVDGTEKASIASLTGHFTEV